MSNKPNCYECMHRRKLPGSRHSSCKNHSAVVIANYYGVENGWFSWPMNFDPVWMEGL